MGCLDDERLLDLAEGRGALDPAAEGHLAACDECRRVLGAAARGRGGTSFGGEAGHAGAVVAGEPSWDELGIGVVVAGRYRLERFLGAGGMGVVWGARRTDDGAAVALKVARSTDRDLCRRVEREARIASRLEHPNVVRTHDVLLATESRGACLVLEWLAGETLEARLAREGTLPLAQAARIAGCIVAALAFAHARGVVHRDLKPQNVFLSRARVVVLDFGVAKLLPAWGAHSKLTRTGAVVGTPRYMAPEQIFGEPDVDARADVWALAAILFRMLAGRAPVSGATLGEIAKGLRQGEVQELASFAHEVPRDVLDLVRGGLLPRERRLADLARFHAVLAAHSVRWP